MNLRAFAWISVLLIVSFSRCARGEDEDYYEEVEEETPQNTTDYKLNVPDSFKSYLEQLLVHEHSADKAEEERKVNNPKHHIKEVKEKLAEQINQDSNKTHSLGVSSKQDHGVDGMWHSLATPLQTSSINLQSGLHPYKSKNISQPIRSLGDGPSVSQHESNHSSSSTSYGDYSWNNVKKTQNPHRVLKETNKLISGTPSTKEEMKATPMITEGPLATSFKMSGEKINRTESNSFHSALPNGTKLKTKTAVPLTNSSALDGSSSKTLLNRSSKESEIKTSHETPILNTHV